MIGSYVVTGGGRGIGQAVVERLLTHGAHVVVVESEPATSEWVDSHPAASRIRVVTGDAGDEAVAERATEIAQAAGPLAGWVNNAAIFRDASVHSSPTAVVLDLIQANLTMAVVGCAAAVRHFLGAGTGGAIVNVSSHQARQAVPGCTPYVTAKAAIEGLTRALAVEYGRHGIRVNAVAPGSVATERYADFLAEQGPEGAARVEAQMRQLHPIGRVARPDEVAAAIVHLLSDDASFINGATVAVDGGRTVLAHDPET
jgi:NAD(P)-dependent dehydrogenase (short-subunit alcohol dehydrogenase family)